MHFATIVNIGPQHFKHVSVEFRIVKKGISKVLSAPGTPAVKDPAVQTGDNSSGAHQC